MPSALEMLADAICCPHKKDAYIASIKVHLPQPSRGGTVFAVQLICKRCGRRLEGVVQEVKS